MSGQKLCLAFTNPDCRDRYVQIDVSQRVDCAPSFFGEHAPGPSIRPGRSHDDGMRHIYQTFKDFFNDSSIRT